jgi:hypothetical protein
MAGVAPPGDLAALLLALAIGAHTLIDLEAPLDYMALARAALALVGAGSPSRKRARRRR